MEETLQISYKELCDIYRDQVRAFKQLAEERLELLNHEKFEYIKLENELYCLKKSLNIKTEKPKVLNLV